MNTIGERIRLIRNSNSLTQFEFSQNLRVTRPHITRIETNKENPSGVLIRLISVLYNVSEEWIKTGAECSAPVSALQDNWLDQGDDRQIGRAHV